MPQVTIDRQLVSKEVIDTPSFFKAWGTTYYAVTGNENNLYIAFFGDGMPLITGKSAHDLPLDGTPVSREEFTKAYEKAQLAIEDAFRESIPALTHSIAA